MSDYNGHKAVVVSGVQMKLEGDQVYYHAGRNEYSIERDSNYLAHPSDEQQRIIDAIFEMLEDNEFADECEKDKTASLHQTDLW